MKKGKFIVLEGGEGSGKSTLIEYLKGLYPTGVHFTREPGGTPIAEIIRSVILSSELSEADGLTQFGLFWSARADHVKSLIRPALNKGEHVVCDRFDSSSYAYQIHGQEAAYLKDLFFEMRKVYLSDTEPNLYIFLKVDPEIGLKRVEGRQGVSNHFDMRKIDFHQRITEGYIEFISKFPHKIIDANQPLEMVKKELEVVVRNVFDEE